MKKILLNYKKAGVLFSLCLYAIMFGTPVYAQTISVKGTVSALTKPVKYASVSFVDKNDSTMKYSALTDSSGSYRLSVIIASVRPENNLPAKFELEQNYPNPFSASTAISYKLKSQTDVNVTIYDILGREVKNFSIGAQSTGVHRILWDGMNSFGEKVATGIYLYRMQAGGETQVKKMIFDAGEKNISLSTSPAFASRGSNPDNDLNVSAATGIFTVKITNTDSTSPIIISKQFDNITVENDTTINFSVDSLPPTPVATIYTDSLQQIIQGFGAANILPWRPDMTAGEVDKAFGTGTGQVGMSILRLRIDPDTNAFSIQVPTAKLAYSMGVKIIASPWTPPPLMKTDSSTVGGMLIDSEYANYAAHLKAFADFMLRNGVPLYAISVQNEPDANVTYESCFWDGTQMLNFMKYNAPSVGVPFFMPESENFKHSLSDPALNDSAAASHIAFIGGHIYGGGLAPYPLAVSKGKEVWMTEHLDTDTSWTHVLATGKEINDCMNTGMSAYIWWYIVRYYGPVDENGNITKRGYIMSQYSRFIRPGFHKVKSPSTAQRNVYLTTYKDSSEVVIVAVNMSSSSVSQTFTLLGDTVNSFTPFVTSKIENCKQLEDITTSGGSFTTRLDASSVTTFVSK